MEFLIELIAEIFFQGMGDVLFDCLLRSKNPTLRTLGSSLLAAMVGGLLGLGSLVLFKSHLVGSPEVRLAMLAGLPFLNGYLMSQVGRSFEKRERARSSFEYFVPAFFFSLGFGVMRFLGAQ